LQRLSVVEYEVVIIGGGLVGAALARSLAQHNIHSLVLDNQTETALYGSELDNRGIALSYSSIQILNSLNLWQKILNAHAIRTVHISEQGAFGFTKLTAAELNLDVLGYVVSAAELGKALVQNLSSELITVMRPIHITAVHYQPSGCWQLEFSGNKIRAKLLVAADGANSLLRNYAAVAVSTKDYQQTAIVCNIDTSQATDIAYERFTAQGVLALLPFGKQQLKCVWTVPNTILAHMQQLEDSEYLAAIQTAFGYRSGKLLKVSARKMFPIHHVALQQLYVPGLVFIGNAANTLHPAAAQGLNLGLRDAQELTTILRHAKNNAIAFNNVQLLQRYSAARQLDHSNTQRFTNSIVEIFASEFTFINQARKFALFAAQFISPIKHRILKQGVGAWQ
jgi:2-octaprenyl-6-methoxyphenol hydroxylase